jgi:hypothetical protein
MGWFRFTVPCMRCVVLDTIDCHGFWCRFGDFGGRLVGGHGWDGR